MAHPFLHRKFRRLAGSVLLALGTVCGSGLHAQPPVAVEITHPRPLPAAHTVHFIGTVEAPETYPASFRSGGRITALPVETGDRIAKGDIIAELDQTAARASLDAAEAGVTAAQAQLDQARQARDRAQGLLDRGTGTQDALDEAMQAFLQARASSDQAQAQLETAQQGMDDTVLRAIDDAVVTERPAEIDEVVSAGQEVVMLANRSAREAVFQAPDIAGLSRLSGRQISVESPDQPQSLSARITEVSPQLSETGTVTIKARLDATGAPLRIGTLITGTIDLSHPERLSLPWDALVSGPQGPAIWVVDPETQSVSLLAVKVAAYNTAGIELVPSDRIGTVLQVVGKGAAGLFYGQKVTPIVEDTP
ncbi:efflux RND transporter periplasmic adaptor subunit [Thioclava sp. 'Guangxiensis']|uniref:efflux RND transporter periplasmic adaptor subunit n=1 Tax=Thioclava sp. 'Guangxiensis' TaxID=3149044 RepID=UPI003877C751